MNGMPVARTSVTPYNAKQKQVDFKNSLFCCKGKHYLLPYRTQRTSNIQTLQLIQIFTDVSTFLKLSLLLSIWKSSLLFVAHRGQQYYCALKFWYIYLRLASDMSGLHNAHSTPLHCKHRLHQQMIETLDMVMWKYDYSCKSVSNLYFIFHRMQSEHDLKLDWFAVNALQYAVNAL